MKKLCGFWKYERYYDIMFLLSFVESMFKKVENSLKSCLFMSDFNLTVYNLMIVHALKFVSIE